MKTVVTLIIISIVVAGLSEITHQILKHAIHPLRVSDRWKWIAETVAMFFGMMAVVFIISLLFYI